jgi:hypothetical protein
VILEASAGVGTDFPVTPKPLIGAVRLNKRIAPCCYNKTGRRNGRRIRTAPLLRPERAHRVSPALAPSAAR